MKLYVITLVLLSALCLLCGCTDEDAAAENPVVKASEYVSEEKEYFSELNDQKQAQLESAAALAE